MMAAEEMADNGDSKMMQRVLLLNSILQIAGVAGFIAVSSTLAVTWPENKLRKQHLVTIWK